MDQGFLVGGECHLSCARSALRSYRGPLRSQGLPGTAQSLSKEGKGLSRDSCWDWGWKDTSRTKDECP